MSTDREPERRPPTPTSTTPPALSVVTGPTVPGPSNSQSTAVPQNPVAPGPSQRLYSPEEEPSQRPPTFLSHSPERFPSPRPVPPDDIAARPQGLGIVQPLPPLPQEIRIANSRRGTYTDQPASTGRPRSGIDWIVPVEEKTIREKTTGERLEPTVATARSEREKYAFKAKMTGYALNAAIGLQVLLGALTTGLSVVTTGHQTSIMTAILGGLATVVASYLARARGSNEPELSITRVKDLEEFIRQCEAFQMDFGHISGDKHDAELVSFRRRFEDLLGSANGERRLAPPV
ncbi:hypothetical protein Hypma_010891 [Hypsizygus marmoreus]|uniref:SMODS and SLOG-associating 2TM effector domain-containing protein n=1 Tax=Hypsizygus marmoreus TaxID=39966 RepID=A0A369JL70_HYPMA|nr:hypothetical protein Hypma_010891 [Hypsizygus marmoreus]